MTIRALSFDYDDCFAHEKYYKLNKDVLTSNKEFLDNLRKDNHKFSKTITFVGSNRQSYFFEMVNMLIFRGACFPDMLRVSTYLNAVFDPFLLADIYSGLEDGASLKSSLFDSIFAYEDNGWMWDREKGTILFAQIQKVANENPNEPIVFDFYDDRGNNHYRKEHTLERLNHFFTKYPYLIPKNVTLRLHHYAGDKVTDLFEIKGEGVIHRNYKQLTKDMAMQAQEKDLLKWYTIGQISTAVHANPGQLSNFNLNNENNTVSPPDASDRGQVEDNSSSRSTLAPQSEANDNIKTAQAYFDAQLQIVKFKMELLEKKGNKLNAQSKLKEGAKYLAAATAIKTLHEQIKVNAEKFLAGKMSKKEFDDSCLVALKKARPILEKHRGWKQILGNLALVVIGFGIGYVAAGLINMATTGHFLFFKTSSEKTIDELEAVRQKLSDTVSNKK